MKFYLRTEAVNLYSVIEDTDDLSTIRGGSLLLLKSTEAVSRRFTSLKPVTTGASNGLFIFEADDIKAAHNVRSKVQNFLASKGEQFNFATFVVDVTPAGNTDADFQHDKEKVLALNRFRQFRQPTLIIPSVNTDAEVTPCHLDRLRPGVKKGPLTTDADGKEQRTRISSSTAIRRAYGQGQENKNRFYRELMAGCDWPDFDHAFVNDFDNLTADPAQGVLHHKMAVIYIDGNHFGRIQHELCRTRALQRKFDDKMKMYRQQVLKKLLKKMIVDKDCQNHQDGGALLRLETLLWGGDELIWVVPAWCGWSVLSDFFDSARQWSFDGHPLFHAAGLVFCHHNAPIHGITRLCGSLAEAAKTEDRDKNLFQYLVMESFDHIGQGLDAFRGRQFPGALANDGFSLYGETMNTVAAHIRGLKNAGFPRRKVVAMAHAACRWADNSDPDGGVYRRLEEQIRKTVPQKARQILETFQDAAFFGQNRQHQPRAFWIHLAQLWDYFAVTDKNE